MLSRRNAMSLRLSGIQKLNDFSTTSVLTLFRLGLIIHSNTKAQV